MASVNKRLVLACDGTWMDSDDGFEKPSLIPYVATGTLQVPSNITRIARALRKTGLDNKPQVIYYQSGVGTESSWSNGLTGGLVGAGISENIREVYGFIAANYVPGDDIVLIGFSRGAFTARSVAGMIKSIGLLTRSGMDFFYPIFKDQQNFSSKHYRDIFPEVPFANKPVGPDAGREYKRRLLEAGLTRVTDPDGTKILVQAVAVWDTVGSLGIPNIALLAKLGLPHLTNEYKFYDTDLHGCISHAFQALALDERRHNFSPAIWERIDMADTTQDLRQVWFAGAHSNVGGGYDDQEVANVSLAWMMDQLASIGVGFDDDFINHIFDVNSSYYRNPRKLRTALSTILSRKPTKQWAMKDIYDKYEPIRPWGLGKINDSEIGIYKLAGRHHRTPGLYKRANPDNGLPTTTPLTNTNERIHSSVRLRLELEGLGPDDIGLYKCPALLDKGLWRLRQMKLKLEDLIPLYASWGSGGSAGNDTDPNDQRWVWEYAGPEETAPEIRLMVEENLGPYERKLMQLNEGRRRQRRRRDHGYEKDRDRLLNGDTEVTEKGYYHLGQVVTLRTRR